MSLDIPLRVAQLRWNHLRILTGPYGLFEHARYGSPRVSHGYTTDDNARAVVVLARSRPSEISIDPYLDFLLAGRTHSGWHNRMSQHGRWLDRVGSDDAHGRALWGLGEYLKAFPGDETAGRALVLGMESFSSNHPRARAYASLGAACAFEAGIVEAVPFLEIVGSQFPSPRPDIWRWFEPRLTYANARIPEAMIRVGAAVGDSRITQDGLDLLEWLIGIELLDGHFSFTPVGGRGPFDQPPEFDQQPIEAWAMVDACHAAAQVDNSSLWTRHLETGASWFLGNNDLGVWVYEPSSGAGFDGLCPAGVNRNRGAESTLAALGSLAQAFASEQGSGK